MINVDTDFEMIQWNSVSSILYIFKNGKSHDFQDFMASTVQPQNVISQETTKC